MGYPERERQTREWWEKQSIFWLNVNISKTVEVTIDDYRNLEVSYEEVGPRPHRRLLVSTHLQSVANVEITRTDRGSSADDILDGR